MKAFLLWRTASSDSFANYPTESLGSDAFSDGWPEISILAASLTDEKPKVNETPKAFRRQEPGVMSSLKTHFLETENRGLDDFSLSVAIGSKGNCGKTEGYTLMRFFWLLCY